MRVVVAVACVLALLASLWGGWSYAGEAVDFASAHAAEWKEGGLAVALGFTILQALVAAFGFLPASLTGLAIGFVLGMTLGFPVAALGTLAGAALAFALARSAIRPFILAQLTRRGFAVPQKAACRGWRFVFMLRLSPVLPFAPASYALGVIGVGWRDFFVGTLASLPSLAAYVWLGSVTTMIGTDWRSLSHPLITVLFWVGVAASVLLAVQILGRFAQRMPLEAR